MRPTASRILAIAAFLIVFCPRHVFAYLDPGTGSMVFQTIVAAIAAVAYTARIYWGKLRSVFGRTEAAGSSLGDGSLDERPTIEMIDERMDKTDAARGQ